VGQQTPLETIVYLALLHQRVVVQVARAQRVVAQGLQVVPEVVVVVKVVPTAQAQQGKVIMVELLPLHQPVVAGLVAQAVTVAALRVGLVAQAQLRPYLAHLLPTLQVAEVEIITVAAGLMARQLQLIPVMVVVVALCMTPLSIMAVE